MGYQVQWYLEQRVVLVTLSGHLSMDEILQMHATTGHMVETGSAPVHILVDVTTLQSHPTNIREIAQASGYLSHANMGWAILINPSRITQFVVTLVGGVTKVKNKSVHSIEEALKVLHHVDITLIH
jgi:hypothetical protein